MLKNAALIALLAVAWFLTAACRHPADYDGVRQHARDADHELNQQQP